MSLLGPINYFLNSSDKFKKLIILVIASLLIITSPITIGYGLRIIKAIRDGSDDMPDLEISDCGGLFVDGLRMMFQALIVFLPVFIVSMVTMAVMASGSTNSIAIGMVVMIIVVVIAAFFMIYYMPAASCLASEEDDWLVILQMSKLKEIIGAPNGMYGRVVGFSLLWGFLLNIVGSLVFVLGFVTTTMAVIAQAYFCGMHMRRIRGGANSPAMIGNTYDASAGNSEDIDYSHDHSKDLYDNSDY